MEKNQKTIIKTFTDDIYIINNKTPDQVTELIASSEMVRMPNGSHINKKAIASIQTYEDYGFQTEQKQRHKKGQFMVGDNWNDGQGPIGMKVGIDRIMGDIKKLNTKN